MPRSAIILIDSLSLKRRIPCAVQLNINTPLSVRNRGVSFWLEIISHMWYNDKIGELYLLISLAGRIIGISTEIFSL